ncbi:hypothetical protein [Pedobacter gandavensis]|uniref:FAS1 domain-containing protein n=1 Tax=Pedobacter gandavensis TaxID=2679963 RepID=A0ABR6ESE8_9SPHI|nr:hypothetical protein [Pedobacter gandavensis]MBB2148190.1 hypothetical protein [Pedobacter gandavensis]
MQHKNRMILLMLAGTLLLFGSCKKYYFDTGLHESKFDGTVLEYLKSKPAFFDSTLRVIDLAGMNDVVNKEEITFFAPPSGTIFKSINRLNLYLKYNGKDTVSQLSQIKPEVWKNTLSQYIFKGKYLLKDYPQRDTVSYVTYPGKNYASYGGRVMNLGVLFNDAGGVIYAGYRQLYLAYIPDLSNPQVALVNVPIASSDIQPSNGVVHVLNKTKHNFGFNTNSFIEQAVVAGILPATP